MKLRLILTKLQHCLIGLAKYRCCTGYIKLRWGGEEVVYSFGLPTKTQELKDLLWIPSCTMFLWSLCSDAGELHPGCCCNTLPSAQQVSAKLAGLCQPGARKAAASSSMVCPHPGAVTVSCVRSMSCLLSFHRSEYASTGVRHLQAGDQSLSMAATLLPPQAAPVWRLPGSAGSFAKPSTCCSS